MLNGAKIMQELNSLSNLQVDMCTQSYVHVSDNKIN